VLQTGITSSGTITSLLLPPGYNRMVTAWYVVVYFGELNSTGSPTRNFTLQVHNYKGNVSMDGTFLDWKEHEVWSTRDALMGPDSTMTLTPLADSMAGPILNGMEFFAKSDPQLDKTTGRDGESRPITACSSLGTINVKSPFTIQVNFEPLIPYSNLETCTVVQFAYFIYSVKLEINCKRLNAHRFSQLAQTKPGIKSYMHGH